MNEKMNKDTRFTFLCDAVQRRMLAQLAQCLRRSQSDAVRVLDREAVSQIETLPATPPPVPAPVCQPGACDQSRLDVRRRS